MSGKYNPIVYKMDIPLMFINQNFVSPLWQNVITEANFIMLLKKEDITSASNYH